MRTSIYKNINSDTLLLNNLENFVGKKVKITIDAIDDTIERKSKLTLLGILRKYANTDLLEKEKTAWSDAIKDKYDS